MSYLYLYTFKLLYSTCITTRAICQTTRNTIILQLLSLFPCHRHCSRCFTSKNFYYLWKPRPFEPKVDSRSFNSTLFDLRKLAHSGKHSQQWQRSSRHQNDNFFWFVYSKIEISVLHYKTSFHCESSRHCRTSTVFGPQIKGAKISEICFRGHTNMTSLYEQAQRMMCYDGTVLIQSDAVIN